MRLNPRATLNPGRTRLNLTVSDPAQVGNACPIHTAQSAHRIVLRPTSSHMPKHYPGTWVLPITPPDTIYLRSKFNPGRKALRTGGRKGIRMGRRELGLLISPGGVAGGPSDDPLETTTVRSANGSKITACLIVGLASVCSDAAAKPTEPRAAKAIHRTATVSMMPFASAPRCLTFFIFTPFSITCLPIQRVRCDIPPYSVVFHLSIPSMSPPGSQDPDHSPARLG